MKSLLLTAFVLFSASTFSYEESEGRRVLRLGCDKEKSALGCYFYANVLLQVGEEDKANEYFDKGCSLGKQEACDKKQWKARVSDAPNDQEVLSENIEDLLPTK